MRSVPTTSADLSDPAFVADPYPLLDELRAAGPVVRQDSGRWLVLDHAGVSRLLRERALGRIWRDKEPTAALEPFNLLHRHQMMESEPPVHTRLRRPVAAAFNRGHVERLRPRVRALAADLLAEVDADADAGFDVVGAYAEPLPVLVIAELLGVPASYAPSLRDWSQAIVRMYEHAPSEETVGAAVSAARDFAALVAELAGERRRTSVEARPADLLSDLVATELSDLEVVASAVLLLNAGHEASVNVFSNGLVGLLRAGLRPADDVALTVEEMLRFDSALQLFERTATAPVDLGDGLVAEPGDTVALLLGAANRDPAVFDAPGVLDPARSPNPHVAFGAGVHFCLGAPLARMELVESLTLLFDRHPDLALAGEPTPRGTFVLRGFHSVPVRAGG